MTAPSVNVAGNVEGGIVVGDNNFVVNTNNGTIVYKTAAPRVGKRSEAPKPPRKPRAFVGRAKELAQLEKWMADSQPILLYGQPGLGKTVLAKQAANTPVATSQPDGVVFLDALTDSGDVPEFNDLVQQIFDSLFESDPPLKVDMGSARTYLSNVHPLLYLNGVSFTGKELDNLASLFPSSPILIEMDHAATEDDFEGLSLGPLDRGDSIALLSERSGIMPDDALRAAFDEIANLLNDVPGALVMIGNGLKEKRFKVEEVAVRLHAIKPNASDTVRSALSRAYRLILSTLMADERAMLVETGSAPGVSVDRKWLEKINRNGGDVSKKLESLQLLYANSPRLRLASGFRPVVLEAADAKDINAAREKLFQDLLSSLKDKWSDFDFVRDELGNLLGLLDWAASQHRWADVIALGRALDPFLSLQGLWDAWQGMLNKFNQAAHALGDRAAEAWALHQLGVLKIGQGENVVAEKYFQRALELRKSLGDAQGMAYTQHNMELIASAAPVKQSSQAVKAYWMIGGVLVIAALVLLLGRYVFKPNAPQPPPTVAVAPASSPVLVASSTFTLTPSPTPSLTPTFTPLPTTTSTSTTTPTSAYGVLTGTINDTANCYYGPGSMYLYKYGLKKQSVMQIIGRADTANGLWLEVQAAIQGNPCWVDSKFVTASGDLSSLEPAYPAKWRLPESPNYPPPMGVLATRSGSQVKISWNFTTPVPLGMRESANSPYWLVELWICQKGQIVFMPMSVYEATVTILDESGCSMPSRGRVYLSDVDGYDGPTNIVWPSP